MMMLALIVLSCLATFALPIVLVKWRIRNERRAYERFMSDMRARRNG